MTKRIVSILTVFTLIFALSTSYTVHADNYVEPSSSITYMDDGSYIVVTISESNSRSTKSGTKTTSYYSSDNELQWKVQVHGTFTYNGSTVSCTKASHTISISNTSWYTYSQNSYTSGNSAIAAVTMKRKVLGVVTSTRSVELKLSCDKNGNLS